MTTNPQKIFSLIVETLSEDLKYWSYEALEKFYRQMLKLLREYCHYKRDHKFGAAKAKLTRFMNSIDSKIDKIKYLREDRKKMLMTVFEVVMRDSGCGLMQKYN